MADTPVIVHALPGGSGDKSWFGRLNPFERAETRRQIEFKRRHWPQMPDGHSSNSKGQLHQYPHLLPEGQLDRALYGPIAHEVQQYCASEGIAIHSEALNLRSSQMCCFNVLFPLRQDLDLAARVLGVLLPGVTAVTGIDFEFTGDDDAATWTGEAEAGGRGRMRTSIDAAIRWTDGQRSYTTLVEWKYTERGFGECAGSDSDGNGAKDFCRQHFAQSDAEAGKCYLTTLGRRYWARLAEAGVDLALLAPSATCPFIGSFYQLMRQHVLAAHLRVSGFADEVFVADIAFRGNASLRTVPKGLAHLGDSTVEAWNALLKDVPPMRTVYADDIGEAIRAAGATAHAEYLKERYGI